MLQEVFNLPKITVRVRSSTDQYLQDVTKLNKKRGELEVVNASLSKSQEVVGRNRHLLPVSWLPQFAVLWRSLHYCPLGRQVWFSCFLTGAQPDHLRMGLHSWPFAACICPERLTNTTSGATLPLIKGAIILTANPSCREALAFVQEHAEAVSMACCLGLQRSSRLARFTELRVQPRIPELPDHRKGVSSASGRPRDRSMVLLYAGKDW